MSDINQNRKQLSLRIVGILQQMLSIWTTLTRSKIDIQYPISELVDTCTC